MVAVRQQVVTRECWTEAEAITVARDQFADPVAARRGGADLQRQAILTRAVETEVIPRLLLARRVTPQIGPPPAELYSARVNAMVSLVLGHELPVVTSFVNELQDQGSPPEELYLDLLAPTARRLGDLWLEDKADFTEVTVGLWRLQQVLRDLGPSFHGNADLQVAGPRALLVPIPGEQHTFGLTMVVDFFRRAGWSVWSGSVASTADLASLVRGQSFGLIGFSVACGDRLEQVAAAIRTVRRASSNRHAGVMVGGPIFIEHPEFAAAVGADATAIDGRQAVQQAQTLLTFLSGRR